MSFSFIKNLIYLKLQLVAGLISGEKYFDLVHERHLKRNKETGKKLPAAHLLHENTNFLCVFDGKRFYFSKDGGMYSLDSNNDRVYTGPYGPRGPREDQDESFFVCSMENGFTSAKMVGCIPSTRTMTGSIQDHMDQEDQEKTKMKCHFIASVVSGVVNDVRGCMCVVVCAELKRRKETVLHALK